MRSFSSERMTEADNMYQKALELGVPDANILMFPKYNRKHPMFPS